MTSKSTLFYTVLLPSGRHFSPIQIPHVSSSNLLKQRLLQKNHSMKNYLKTMTFNCDENMIIKNDSIKVLGACSFIPPIVASLQRIERVNISDYHMNIQ